MEACKGVIVIHSGMLVVVSGTGSCSGLTIAVLSALGTPVEDVVVLVPLTGGQVPEEFTEVRVIRGVIELKSTAVVEEGQKLVG